MLHQDSDVNAYRHIMKVSLQPDISARLISDRDRMENHGDN
jgi:hypothetical protein